MQNNIKHTDEYISNYILNKYGKGIKVLSKYENAHKPLLILDVVDNTLHKIRFNQLDTRNWKPTIESAVEKTEYFIKQAIKIHNDKYDYSKVNYVNSRKTVDIVCSTHGLFKQTPGNHLYQKQGCPVCGKEVMGGRSKENWIGMCKKPLYEPLLYFIRCFNEDEEFIKIGITSKSIHKRFCGRNAMPYEFEVIKEIKGSAGFIWDKEKELHNKYKEYKYLPKIRFGGFTECFTLEVIK